MTKKWVEVFDQSQENYNPNKEIRIKTSMLKSDLCDFSDAYIVVTGNITVVKKTFTTDDIEAPNNTWLMQLVLIMQMIMHLVTRNCCLKTIHHLSIVYQKLMV